jgi:CubicO group peptidase (beta-lactamase class C family)
MQPVRPHRWRLALCLAALVCSQSRADDFPRVAPEAAGLSSAQLKKIDELFQAAVDKRQIAGSVVLLARDGKIGYLRASGMQDAEGKTAMAADTLFRIASMTKPVTSVAVMMLAAEGNLSVADTLSKYLPEFKDAKVLVPGKNGDGADYTIVPADRQITIRDLLTHTSGITYRFWGRKYLTDLYRKAGVSDGLVHPEGTIADNVKRLAGCPLLHQPGTAWEYGLNTDVLGRVVEVASGQDLSTFFETRIFKPLGMRDTFFFVPGEKRSRLAALYAPGADKTVRRVGEGPVTVGELIYSASYPYREPRTYFSGGAGLVSTAGDYARFLQTLLNGGELYGVRLLKADTVQAMTQNQIGKLKPGIQSHGIAFGYGFGIVTKENRNSDVASVGTFSWGGIFNTYFWADPKERLIGMMMTQLYPSGHLTLAADFKKLAYAALVK